MDIKKYISDNKVPIIVIGTVLVITILYFTNTKLKVGSKKESTDIKGEDIKGGLLIPTGKDYVDVKILSSSAWGDEVKFYIRYYKDKRFKILVVKNNETKSTDRGNWRNDGLILEFEDGKFIEASSISTLVEKLKNTESITAGYLV